MTVAHRFSESKYWKIQYEVIPIVTPNDQKNMRWHPIERGPELNKALEFTLIRKKESDPSECQSRLAMWSSMKEYTTSSSSYIEKYNVKSTYSKFTEACRASLQREQTLSNTTKNHANCYAQQSKKHRSTSNWARSQSEQSTAIYTHLLAENCSSSRRSGCSALSRQNPHSAMRTQQMRTQ